MVSLLLFSTQRYLSLSLRKSIQWAIRRSATITVDSLISAPNSSDNHKTQQKSHWTICSITNYTKIFPEKSLHRNRLFSTKNSLHSSKRQHAQTQEQILNLLRREFCLSNDTKHRRTAHHIKLFFNENYKFFHSNKEKSNKRHDEGTSNRTLTQKSDSRKHWEKQKTIVVNINSSIQTIKSVIIARKTTWNMMKIQETHAQLNNFSLCTSKRTDN